MLNSAGIPESFQILVTENTQRTELSISVDISHGRISQTTNSDTFGSMTVCHALVICSSVSQPTRNARVSLSRLGLFLHTYFLILCVWMFCLRGCLCIICVPGPREVRRERWILWSHRQLWTTVCVLGTELNPLNPGPSSQGSWLPDVSNSFIPPAFLSKKSASRKRKKAVTTPEEEVYILHCEQCIGLHGKKDNEFSPGVDNC